MIIRNYNQADYFKIIKLHNDGLDEHCVNMGPGPWDNDLQNIDYTYHRNGGTFLVGCINTEIIAMGALLRIDVTTGEIRRMRVDINHRRNGYGQKILDELISFSAINGMNRLTLDTTDKQLSAQSLYLKNGFVVIKKIQELHFNNIFFERIQNGAQQVDAPEPATMISPASQYHIGRPGDL